MSRPLSIAVSALALLLLQTAGCGSTDGPSACTAAAPDALQTCVADYGAALAACYVASDGPCDAADPNLATALGTLERRVRNRCDDGGLFGLSADAVVGRLRNACQSEASALTWRTFGGPHGAAWERADEGTRTCLLAAHEAGLGMLDASLSAVNACLMSGACDSAALATEREGVTAATQASVMAACPGLSDAVAIDVPTYISRANDQVDCLTAIAQVDTGDLPLTCGPSNADFDIPRGEWTQITVDGDKWGTLCGDGSSYAFWVHLAPEGQPLDQLVIGLQGGGVCAFEDDCTSRLAANPELFRALDDTPTGGGGIGSDDPTVNPFANWTRVYLPYCNQDVFAGGGVNEELGALSLPRYGSVNLRAAVRMTRDVLWRELDAEGGAGFRADEVVSFFGGWSAGAYGTLYNYHWMLDELQWPRTVGFADAGQALDNGEFLGVRGLGRVKVRAWAFQNSLPSYCTTGDCAVGPTLYRALSPRLLQVPEQQLLVLSNPRDTIQQGDAFFTDEASWINAQREVYCETRDLPGIQYYLTSQSDEPVHVVSIRDELWSVEVDGETMSDWFERAVNDPSTLVDRAEEGDFVTDVVGVNAYPCTVAP